MKGCARLFSQRCSDKTVRRACVSLSDSPSYEIEEPCPTPYNAISSYYYSRLLHIQRWLPFQCFLLSCVIVELYGIIAAWASQNDGGAGRCFGSNRCAYQTQQMSRQSEGWRLGDLNVSGRGNTIRQKQPAKNTVSGTAANGLFQWQKRKPGLKTRI